MWMVRNSGGDYAEEFLQQGVVAIGWPEVGSLAGLKSREAVIEAVKRAYPHYSPKQAIVNGGQIDKIVNGFKPGDDVVTYDPSTRTYHIGRVAGEYEFFQQSEMPNRRRVEWRYAVERDRLSLPARNSLGSSLTIFSIGKDVAAELMMLATRGGKADIPDQDIASASEENPELLNLVSLREQAREFIKDRVVKLEWDSLQHLVAGMLRAMGYKTQVSPAGPDRGKDVIASPDGFGFEQPRIVVEVKHRPGHQMGSPEVRSFLGGRHKDDRGLFVSTGGFSRDAKYEAERAAIPLTLMDIDSLVETIVENYEELDLATRTLLPLSKIYWPA